MRQHLGLQQRTLQQRGLQQLLQPLLQQGAGAAQLTGAQQLGAGAQQVGAGAQQLGAGAQQLLQHDERQNAFASLTLAQQNKTAAAKVVHFIISVSWNGVSTRGLRRTLDQPTANLRRAVQMHSEGPTIRIAVWD